MIARGDPEYWLREAYGKILKESHQLRLELTQLKQAHGLIKHEKKKYTYQNAVSALPPNDILEKAMQALDEYHLFNSFAEVLGDYYGIASPRYLNDNIGKVLPNSHATYYPDENTVYCPKGPFKYRTAFHEFWHALERHGLVPPEKEEENAEIYAKFCLRQLGRDENS